MPRPRPSSRAAALASSFALVAALAGPRAARADDSNDAASAALFEEAKALMASGRDAEACPKLERSVKLVTTGGNVLHLALCYEKVGRTASAWVRFNQALSLARASSRADREQVAKERIAALAPTLARWQPAVKADAPSLRLAVDGVEVPREAWGSPIPVDPGPHAIVASQPGFEGWTGRFEAEPAKTITVSVPALERAPAAPVVGAAPGPDGPKPTATSPARGDHGARRWQLPVGVGVGAAGVVGLGIGAIFGVSALGKNADSEPFCPAADRCTSAGVALREDAVAAGNLSTIGFVAGGVLAAAGLVLVLTAPRSGDAPRAALHVSPRGLTLEGAL